jgi:hypothetical protein
MAQRHRAAPVVGVQFHPESILTEHGYQFLTNFLEMADIAMNRPATIQPEINCPRRAPAALPKSPVTF